MTKLFAKSLLKRAGLSIAIIAAAAPAQAEYNANHKAIIKDVMVYDDGHFLLVVDQMPAGPCSQYFVVPVQVPSDGRQAMLARALLAKASSDKTNIGYDSKTCVNGWYLTHMIGG